MLFGLRGTGRGIFFSVLQLLHLLGNRKADFSKSFSLPLWFAVLRNYFCLRHLSFIIRSIIPALKTVGQLSNINGVSEEDGMFVWRFFFPDLHLHIFADIFIIKSELYVYNSFGRKRRSTAMPVILLGQWFYLDLITETEREKKEKDVKCCCFVF